MNRLAMMVTFAAVAGCGGSNVSVTVNLQVSSLADLDPYQGSGRLTQVRVTVNGPDRNDDVTSDVPLTARSTMFSDFPSDRTVAVTVEGFDNQGTLLAFGESQAVKLDGDDVTLDIPFRRALAYVTHSPICNGGCTLGNVCSNVGDGFTCLPSSDQCGACTAEQRCVAPRSGPVCGPRYTRTSRGPSQVYVLDAVTRTLLTRVTLPGTAPRARGISARAGLGMVVAYNDGADGNVGFLSADDHSWTTVKLDKPAELALMGAGSVGAVAGGGVIVLFDLATKTVISETPVGGRVLDGAVGADGTKGIFVVSASPHVVLVDFDRQTIVPPGDVSGASGVAMTGNGRIAFVTSETQTTVVSVDMETGAIRDLAPPGFAGLVQNAVYADSMKVVLGLQNDPEENVSRVLAYNVSTQTPYDFSTAVGTPSIPTGIAAGPKGRRVLVVSAGTTTVGAGLTVIDPDQDLLPDGSTVRYPPDPDDTFVTGGFVGQQTYHPYKIAVLYGR